MSGEVIAKQNRYMRRLRDADAVTPDRAVALADIGAGDSVVFRRLVKRGVIVDAGGGRFYLDRERADAFIERRRQFVVWMIVVALIALAIALLLSSRLSAQQAQEPIIHMHLHAMGAADQGRLQWDSVSPMPRGSCG
jgi:hypothetical protein